jgi:twitching motility protein PilU
MMDTHQAWQSVQQLLTVMHQRGGSDMFITAGFSPAIKLDG